LICENRKLLSLPVLRLMIYRRKENSEEEKLKIE